MYANQLMKNLNNKMFKKDNCRVFRWVLFTVKWFCSWQRFEHRNSIGDNSFRALNVHWTASPSSAFVSLRHWNSSSYNSAPSTWNSRLFSYFSATVRFHYTPKLDKTIQGLPDTTLPYMEASEKYRRACLWRLLLRFRRTKKAKQISSTDWKLKPADM